MHMLFLARLAFFMAIGALLAFIFWPDPAYAQAIDFRPTAALAGEYLAVAIQALLAGLFGWGMRFLHLSGSREALKLEELTRNFVHETVDRGIARALEKLPDGILTVDARWPFIESIASYVQEQAPDALHRLGAGPDQLERLIEAKLGDWIASPRKSIPGLFTTD